MAVPRDVIGGGRVMAKRILRPLPADLFSEEQALRPANSFGDYLLISRFPGRPEDTLFSRTAETKSFGFPAWDMPSGFTMIRAEDDMRKAMGSPNSSVSR